MTDQSTLSANPSRALSTSSLSPVPSSDKLTPLPQPPPTLPTIPSSTDHLGPPTTTNTAVDYSYSPATAELLAKISVQRTRDYDEAKNHILNSIVTSDRLPLLPPSTNGSRGPGRPKGSTGKGRAPGTPVAAGRGGLSSGRGRGAGRGRGGGKKRGRKRKRDSDEEDGGESEGGGTGLGDDDEDGDNSDEGGVKLPMKTKSGRNVHRPAQFVPIITSPTATTATTPGAGGIKKRRKMTGRKNVENTVCKACERGHSPPNNAIVFCDGCSGAWHQYCHDPPIEKEAVDVAEKEWLCRECAVASRMYVVLPKLETYELGGELGADEKRARLMHLRSEQLVDILMAVHGIYPNIAIFPPKEDLHLADNPENHYDGYETDPPQHYPKPGNGLARTLPPETEDDRWLLDDNFDVFQQLNYDGGHAPDTNVGLPTFSLATADLNGEASATAGATNGIRKNV